MSKGQPGEPETSQRAFADYCAMGEGRNLEDLAARYEHADNAPTKSIHTLKQWSADWNWQDGLADWKLEKNRQVLKALRDDAAGHTVKNAKRIIRLLAPLDDEERARALSKKLKPGDVKGLVETLQKLVGAPLEDKASVTVRGDEKHPVPILHLGLEDLVEAAKNGDGRDDSGDAGAGEDGA